MSNILPLPPGQFALPSPEYAWARLRRLPRTNVRFRRVVAQNRIVAPLAALLSSGGAAAQAPDVIRVGVLSNMTGRYADLAGNGSVIAARLAEEEFPASSSSNARRA